MVPPSVYTTAISQASGMVTLVISAVSAFLIQPVKDASLRASQADFLRHTKRVGYLLDEINTARPVVTEYQWDIVVQLGEVIKEAKDELAPGSRPVSGSQEGQEQQGDAQKDFSSCRHF